jgi:asparagine synthase (glutamine-hydrolysing)
LIERPKSGFSIPLADWLRGPLRDWAENLLDERLLREQGFFDPDVIRCTWRQHMEQQHDWSERLWCILMFQAWLEEAASSQGLGSTP